MEGYLNHQNRKVYVANVTASGRVGEAALNGGIIAMHCLADAHRIKETNADSFCNNWLTNG